MANKEDAARACKDPNPIIDGRKANVNLAYIGAKPRLMQSEWTKFQKLTLFNSKRNFSSNFYVKISDKSVF